MIRDSLLRACCLSRACLISNHSLIFVLPGLQKANGVANGHHSVLTAQELANIRANEGTLSRESALTLTRHDSLARDAKRILNTTMGTVAGFEEMKTKVSQGRELKYARVVCCYLFHCCCSGAGATSR